MAPNVFWKLVHHEFHWSGNRRKSKRKLSGKWWAAYIIFVILLGFFILTMFSGSKGFNLQNLWFFSLGLPFAIFFIGYGTVKKEWDNETQGWWLSLPYSRSFITGAKLLGSLLQTWLVLVGVYLLAVIYGFYMIAVDSHLAITDLGAFLLTGFAWIFVLVIFSPLILALGMSLSLVVYTEYRPVTPILWVVYMGAGSFFYWGYGNIEHVQNFYGLFTGKVAPAWFPFPFYIYGLAVIGWVFTYLIVRYLGGLLEKKLAL